ncbi:MAG TPA: hypothetical protein DCQ32_00370 [Cyanobacteria bacterium UBA8156]|nr:hypothetical protein [Cyanobacteria bacterium UBA8156]
MGLLGAAPIAGLIWVQWRQPFYPFRVWFGVWGQYQAPEDLTERQRQGLARLLPMPHQPWLHPHGWLAVVSGWFVYAGFRQLYVTAPAVETAALLPPYLRLLGVLWAVVWVGIATMLLQGAVTAARLLFLAGGGGDPLPVALSVAQIRKKFTFWGQEGGTLLKVLGVPKPIDDAGRAVVEPSPSAPKRRLDLLVDLLDLETMPPVDTETPDVAVEGEAGALEPPITTTTVVASETPEVPVEEGPGVIEPLRADTAPVVPIPETFGEVAIEPLVTPVFVNVVEDTPQPNA